MTSPQKKLLVGCFQTFSGRPEDWTVSSTYHLYAARMLLLPDRLMSCCAAGTDGCLDLRHCAFALSGQVGAGWSKCLGSIARRARDSVAPLQRSSAGWML